MRRLLPFVLLLLAAVPATAEDSLETLVDRLKGEDSQLWIGAYNELQRRKDPKVIPLLLAAAPELATGPQSYAVYIINALPDSKLARNALRAMTKMEPPYLRARAARALYDKGEREMGKVAVQIAKDVRGDDAQAALVLGALTYFRAPELQAYLREWLAADPPLGVFTQLINYFRLLTDRKPVVPTLEARVAHANPTVRGLAAAYVYAYGPPGKAIEYGEVVAEALRTGEIEQSAFTTIDFMLSSAAGLTPAILEAAAERVVEEQGYYAARLLRLLGRGSYSGLVPLAKKLLDDDDKQVAKAAFEVLSAVPGGFSREALAGLLGSGDDERRLMAAESLRRTDDVSGLAAVIDVLGSTTSMTTRRDAARILGDFRTAASVEPLLDAMASPDSIVRSSAGSSLQRVWGSLFPYRRIDLGSTGWSYGAPEASRKPALERLRAWWKTHKDARW